MTTKPKARKYRLRRAGSLLPPGAEGTGDAGTADGAGTPDATATAPQGDPPHPAPGAPQADTAEALAAIGAEGLTGRQLRMARRLAEKYGLPARSDFDAVRLLRASGIDPSERARMLELVVPGSEPERPAPRVQLPQTVDPAHVPSTRVAPPQSDAPARQIREIQRDIARRRRRKLTLLACRLLLFVGLPTAAAGYYYFEVATPMYATHTEFVIQQADPVGGSPAAGLFSGTGFATSQDSVTVQSYLQSRDAMLRLDADAGFRAHFSQDWIDPLQRLPENATMERTYDLYQDHVQIGYDPTEGIVRMEVIAADPQVSADYSRRLIDYAERRVDDITQRLRDDQMRGAGESLEAAEARLAEAQARVLELQEQLGVLDPASESAAIMGQVTNFETQLFEKQLELDQLLANDAPNRARVEGVQGDIARLASIIEGLRGQMTDGTSEASSLARVSSELRLAEVDLQTRTLMMQQALQALETARIEANRQTRYLSLGVTPVVPDEATYPRAFENTALALLIFSGIYLMLSLTASILREQVSA